jgi:Sigma-70 region 2
VRAEHEEDFRQFVVDSRHRLVRTAYVLTGDYARAEDLVQSALVRTYRAWDRIERLPGLPDHHLGDRRPPRRHHHHGPAARRHQRRQEQSARELLPPTTTCPGPTPETAQR